MRFITTQPRRGLFAITVCVIAASAGCFFGYSASTEHLSNPDSAVGEEYEYNYSTADTLQFAEEALRGDGILFEVQTDNSIITFWRDADANTPLGWFETMLGNKPRYHYEIQLIPEGGQRAKMIVNVRTEFIPDELQASYKASNRFALFKEIDELASKYPAPSKLPSSGGVNFALLPNEDLKALAKRVTGKETNWPAIAKDNGLVSATDVVPFQNVWVRNSLLKAVPH